VARRATSLEPLLERGQIVGLQGEVVNDTLGAVLRALVHAQQIAIETLGAVEVGAAHRDMVQ